VRLHSSAQYLSGSVFAIRDDESRAQDRVSRSGVNLFPLPDAQLSPSKPACGCYCRWALGQQPDQRLPAFYDH